MRKFTKLIASAATAVAAAAIVAGSVTTAAYADPPKGVTPHVYDIVGAGSDTTESVLDQFSHDYNATIPAKQHTAAHPYFYSWDAVPPGATGPGTYYIIPKAGCATKTGKGILRPNGSTSGLKALDQNMVSAANSHYYCLDFGRSSAARSATAPPPGPHGVLYVAFARDALTWATRGSKFGGSNAPVSLNIHQLFDIFDCKVSNWDQVGGKNGKIKVYLPQPGSGSLATWEKQLGLTALGPCVSQAPEENEGTNPLFNDPNAIFVFSIGSWVSQEFHSAKCGVKPTGKQNLFGCNATGFLVPNEISGVKPMTSAAVPVINPAFPAHFWRTLYNIVRWTSGTRDHIPGNLEPFFSSAALHGFMCTNALAKKDISDYGFVNYGKCGATS